MFQFSLRNLLVAIAFVAAGAAALASANAWWLSISWGAALFLVASAVLLAVHSREGKRAYWTGFAVFGALYVLLLMYSIQNVSSANSSILAFSPLTYFNLVTTKVTSATYAWLPASITTEYAPGSGASAGGVTGFGIPPLPGMPGGYTGGMPGNYTGGMPMSGFGGSIPAPPTPNPRFVPQSIYLEVGHAFWTIFLAWLGGVISWWLYERRERANR